MILLPKGDDRGASKITKNLFSPTSKFLSERLMLKLLKAVKYCMKIGSEMHTTFLATYSIDNVYNGAKIVTSTCSIAMIKPKISFGLRNYY